MITYTSKTQLELFQDAIEEVKVLPRKPLNTELLILYGYYKQGINGDNQNPKPGIFNTTERIKWYAWEKNKLMSRNTAQLKYTEFVSVLQNKYGFEQMDTVLTPPEDISSDLC